MLVVPWPMAEAVVGITRATRRLTLVHADPLPLAPSSSWAMFNPMTADDAQRAVWLLRLNYVRLRRQRLTPLAASSSALLREHEDALATVSPKVTQVVQRTQARRKPRPLPSLDA